MSPQPEPLEDGDHKNVGRDVHNEILLSLRALWRTRQNEFQSQTSEKNSLVRNTSRGEDDDMGEDDEEDYAASESDDAEETEETAMLDLDLPEAPKRTGAAKKNNLGQTRVVVHALIGIGNKPYLRGKGPGLNWERGVPMDFVEIGKWEWKTMRANEAVEFQLWLNDEKPCEGDSISVEPGATATLSPRFPA